MNRFERQEMYEKDHKVGKYKDVETVEKVVDKTTKPRGRKKGDK